MTVVLNKQTLDLNFKHHLPTALPGTQATKAFLQDKAGKILLEGYALCSEMDQYCKDKGRKVALTRMLRDVPRETRRQIWLAYHDMRGKVGNECGTN